MKHTNIAQKATGFFLTLFSILLISCGTQKGGAIETVSPKVFSDRMSAEPNSVLLDVRTPEEYGEGHLANSVNLDVNSGVFEKEIEKLDKKSTYYVYCRSGKRSLNASEIMAKAGFKKIINLETGITGWQGEGLPVTK